MPWDEYVPGSVLSSDTGNKSLGIVVLALLNFFSYVQILNTVVPISLYVR